MLTKKGTIKNEEKPKEIKKSSSHLATPLAKMPTRSLVKTPSLVKTKIIVKYDVGYANQLTIRGEGANLSWTKGQSLKNIKSDEWVWETTGSFQKCQFKILINDQHYELGDNHLLNAGTTIQYIPRF